MLMKNEGRVDMAYGRMECGLHLQKTLPVELLLDLVPGEC